MSLPGESGSWGLVGATIDQFSPSGQPKEDTRAAGRQTQTGVTLLSLKGSIEAPFPYLMLEVSASSTDFTSVSMLYVKRLFVGMCWTNKLALVFRESEPLLAVAWKWDFLTKAEPPSGKLSHITLKSPSVRACGRRQFSVGGACPPSSRAGASRPVGVMSAGSAYAARGGRE